jgi:DNA repair exonuclease SbcCD nuclease subunit
MSEAEGKDVALTLLHTADWHLGKRFQSFPREQELRLTRARLEVVGRILDLAHSRNVDAVMCAGDLFDSPSPETEWWEGVLKEFERRRNWTRPVFLLPGNHDPLTPRSLYHPSHPFRAGLPSYVHVVDEDGFTHELGGNAVVIANPCRSHAGQSDLASSLPSREPGDERIRIGLVHGQTFDIEGNQTNFPIARGIAQERGFNYLAIGDTHAFREVEPGAPVPTVYPSAPEATNFGEKDTGYVALVFFPRDRSRRALIERARVGVWTWREATCHSMAELRALRADENLRKTVLRLGLEMKVPLNEYDEAERILTELRGSLSANPRVGVLVADRSRLRLAMDEGIDFGQELPPVLESVLLRLREKAQTDPERAERALHHLYQLLHGGG